MISIGELSVDWNVIVFCFLKRFNNTDDVDEQTIIDKYFETKQNKFNKWIIKVKYTYEKSQIWICHEDHCLSICICDDVSLDCLNYGNDLWAMNDDDDFY